MAKIQFDNFDEIPEEVNMTIVPAKRATLRIVKVEELPDAGESGCVKFTLRVQDHPEADYNSREFTETFWYPDPKATQLQFVAAQSKWKQLCLATGILPDSEGGLDPNDFVMSDFDAEITNRKDKNDKSKSYAGLGKIYFSTEG
jgi:hypothetical protein